MLQRDHHLSGLAVLEFLKPDELEQVLVLQFLVRLLKDLSAAELIAETHSLRESILAEETIIFDRNTCLELSSRQ